MWYACIALPLSADALSLLQHRAALSLKDIAWEDVRGSGTVLDTLAASIAVRGFMFANMHRTDNKWLPLKGPCLWAIAQVTFAATPNGCFRKALVSGRPHLPYEKRSTSRSMHFAVFHAALECTATPRRSTCDPPQVEVLETPLATRVMPC